MTEPVLAARVRDTKGKGAARKLRKNAQIPAVFYGPKTAPIMLVVKDADLDRVFKEHQGENVIMDLQVTSGEETKTMKTMIKELQVDPIRRTYLHADFYEISMDKEITVDIPIRLLNTPVGVSRGGVLQHIRRELTISCLPSALVDTLDVDVSHLDIGDSLHLRDIPLPEGIESEEEEHLTVAVVVAPSVKEEVEAVEEGEPEEAAGETGGTGADDEKS